MFTPKIGEGFQFDNFFLDGWFNHQPEKLGKYSERFSSNLFQMDAAWKLMTRVVMKPDRGDDVPYKVGVTESLQTKFVFSPLGNWGEKNPTYRSYSPIFFTPSNFPTYHRKHTPNPRDTVYF